jgi:predicted AAA+ superfamily ATPase
MEETKMIQLHPKFLTQDGQKVAILPYDEFLKIQEILEDLEDLENLRQAKEEAKDSPTYSLDEVKQMQEQSLNDWQTAIDQIGKKI